MIAETSAVAFRQKLGEMLNQVQYRHDSVVIIEDGKPVAALVDLRLLERIRRVQARFDALCRRLETGFSSVPEDDGMAEIVATVAARRAGRAAPRPNRACATRPIGLCWAPCWPLRQSQPEPSFMPSQARPRAIRTGSSDRGTPRTTEPGPSCGRAWRSRVGADTGNRAETKPLPWLDTAEGDTLTYRYRPAVPDDAPRCVAVRGQTRENAFSVDQLKAIGVTVDSWRAGIADGSLPGHVCLFDGGRAGGRDGGAGGGTGGNPGSEVIGYCFGAPSSGEVVVLALLPEHENRGIGKKLLDTLVSDFKALGHQRLFLGCSANPAVRSYGFYRHQGWRSTGTVDAANDEVLELLLT